MKFRSPFKSIPLKFWVVFAFLMGSISVVLSIKVYQYTSTDAFCMSCHVHPHAEEAWKLSVHYDNKSGIVVHCVQCHLPPSGTWHNFTAKASTGARDVYAMIFKDTDKINWEAKRTLEAALKHTYEESCKTCHQELFPRGLSADGEKAHLHYEQNAQRLNLNCLNCHLDAGHYNPNYKHERMKDLPGAETGELFTEPAQVASFENFTEQIPGTSVTFNMIAIPAGIFLMGSPKDEPLRKDDEGPVREVTISPFFMGETEVSWKEFWAFYRATMSEGRIAPNIVMNHNASHPDVISGPTPPFGIPEQGWGGGNRPAITMTPYAAEMYCQWLSQRTGKKYRLPTEAEWEFAARGGTQTPYFFPGNPKRFAGAGLRGWIFGADTTNINSYAIYRENSLGRTMEPGSVKPNPFGLKNMSGNVYEYTSDWYAPDAYAQTDLNVTNPKGPASGTERVIRGGSFESGAADLRSAARAKTDTEAWFKTDPQQPRSLWWYSDMRGIGFRVVCEPEADLRTDRH
jgi:formylglycine-generating enzyme